jgi:hypothetical protein
LEPFPPSSPRYPEHELPQEPAPLFDIVSIFSRCCRGCGRNP